MNINSIYFHPCIPLDDMVLIRVALSDRAAKMRACADQTLSSEAYVYFSREARRATRILRQLREAPTVDLDDMERHATR